VSPLKAHNQQNPFYCPYGVNVVKVNFCGSARKCVCKLTERRCRPGLSRGPPPVEKMSTTAPARVSEAKGRLKGCTEEANRRQRGMGNAQGRHKHLEGAGDELKEAEGGTSRREKANVGRMRQKEAEGRRGQEEVG
jgi:hypothetical protein